MLALMGGAAHYLEGETTKLWIGIIGGIVLLGLGSRMLWDLRSHANPADPKTLSQKSCIWTGLSLSAANPYFLVWWATIGLKLINDSLQWGAAAFAAFAICHWLCDLIWLELISLASHKGSRLLHPKIQSRILAVTALILLAFGLWYLLDALVV